MMKMRNFPILIWRLPSSPPRLRKNAHQRGQNHHRRQQYYPIFVVRRLQKEENLHPVLPFHQKKITRVVLVVLDAVTMMVSLHHHQHHRVVASTTSTHSPLSLGISLNWSHPTRHRGVVGTIRFDARWKHPV